MTDQAMYLAALCTAISVVTAMLTVRAMARLHPANILGSGEEDRAVFLIEGGRIIDATPTGHEMLSIVGADADAAEALLTWLSEPFPSLTAAVKALDSTPERRLIARDGVARLQIARDGARMRLTLSDDPTERVSVDRVLHGATTSELESLRQVADALPHAMWRQDADGRITWVNRAYLDLLRDVKGERPAFPLQQIFPDLEPPAEGTVRVALEERFFDCRAVRAGNEVMISAMPADALVQAEEALAAFKQTMSRTFAQLTVGLAVFDRWRRLAVFNPALTDLTALPIDILLSRPTLESFLDILRARQIMPEPRDYSSWRDKVLDVERGAQSGTYSELWHLTDGRTYRITGRPQPDGAFALLMEDISGEMSLTRRFRSEIETSRAVLDAMPDAVAVFDDAGHLVMTNDAYDSLWQIDTIDSVTQLSLRDARATWEFQCEPGVSWDAIMAEREGRHDLRHSDGRRLALVCSGLPGGARLMRFRVGDAEVSTLMPARAHKMIADRLKA